MNLIILYSKVILFFSLMEQIEERNHKSYDIRIRWKHLLSFWSFLICYFGFLIVPANSKPISWNRKRVCQITPNQSSPQISFITNNQILRKLEYFTCLLIKSSSTFPIRTPPRETECCSALKKKGNNMDKKKHNYNVLESTGLTTVKSYWE